MKNDQGAYRDEDGTGIRKMYVHLIHRRNQNDNDGSYDNNNDDEYYNTTVHSFVHVLIHSFIVGPFHCTLTFLHLNLSIFHTSPSQESSSLRPRLASLTPSIHISLGLPPVPPLTIFHGNLFTGIPCTCPNNPLAFFVPSDTFLPTSTVALMVSFQTFGRPLSPDFLADTLTAISSSNSSSSSSSNSNNNDDNDNVGEKRNSS